MENIILEFKTENLEIKLSKEKLFINTLTSSETFALRSINGIGVVDLVDEFNKALTNWKRIKNDLIVGYVYSGGFVIGGLLSMSLWPFLGIMLLGFALLILILVSQKQNKNVEPKLMSAVRIMMSGGNRDFQFNKSDNASKNIAEFVAKIESTLTAYQTK